MMNRSFVEAACCALCAGCLWLAAPAKSVRAADDPPRSAPADEVFGPTRVWSLHLEIPADEFQALQPAPPAGGFFGGPGGPGAQGNAPQQPNRDPSRPTVRNLFGVEFPWGYGQLTADGRACGKVGIRYDGDAAWFASAFGQKRSFKLDLDLYGDSQFHGLRALNLHCGALDPTKGRTALACAVFRAAGVPAPRTALAEVLLSVPGRYRSQSSPRKSRPRIRAGLSRRPSRD